MNKKVELLRIMVKIESFLIKLNKSTPVYSGGEQLSGTVEIEVRERVKINTVRLLIEGYSRVRW